MIGKLIGESATIFCILTFKCPLLLHLAVSLLALSTMSWAPSSHEDLSTVKFYHIYVPSSHADHH